MSYYSFKKLNDSLQSLNVSDQLLYLGDFISLRQSLQPLLAAVPNNYSRAYGQVQLLKYDSSGNPSDVTSAEALTVPDSVISYAKARQAEINSKLKRITQKINELSPASKARVPTDQVRTLEPYNFPYAGENLNLFLSPLGKGWVASFPSFQRSSTLYTVRIGIIPHGEDMFSGCMLITSDKLSALGRLDNDGEIWLGIDPNLLSNQHKTEMRSGIVTAEALAEGAANSMLRNQAFQLVFGLAPYPGLNNPSYPIVDHNTVTIDVPTSQILTNLGVTIVDPDW